MWERLNEADGNEGKLIDAILGDIRSYKPLHDGEDRKLINLINTVEKVWLDVSNLKLTRIGEYHCPDSSRETTTIKVEKRMGY